MASLSHKPQIEEIIAVSMMKVYPNISALGEIQILCPFYYCA